MEDSVNGLFAERGMWIGGIRQYWSGKFFKISLSDKLDDLCHFFAYVDVEMQRFNVKMKLLLKISD